MRCPRCDGLMIEDEGNEKSCLNCGFLDLALSQPLEKWRPGHGRMDAQERLRGRSRIKPMPQGFGSNRPGYCVNGHGFRAVDHQACIGKREQSHAIV